MDNPLVSIGLPTYNRPKTLARTLNSLVNQSYANLEIIVSDNGSTIKEIEEIISPFLSDRRIKYIRHPVNRGAIFNFNFVLKNISGDFFMRLGDDDWLDPNYVESCLLFLLKNPDYICAYGRTRIFNLNNEFVRYDADINLSEESYSDRMESYFRNVAQNALFFGLIRKEYKDCVANKELIADDWLGAARLCFNGKIGLVDETNLNMSLGGTGSSVESIVQAFGLSDFNKSFPYLSVSINIYLDILWKSKVYKKIGLIKRVSLAWKCSSIIYNRFNVKSEIGGAYKGYLLSLINSKK
jgi:glycosyltransferase domain-containing protein